MQENNVSVRMGDTLPDESAVKIGSTGDLQYVKIIGINPAEYGTCFTITAGNITIQDVSVYGCMKQAFAGNGASDRLVDVLRSLYAYAEASRIAMQ